MKAVILAILPTIGFVVGVAMAKWTNRDRSMTRGDRKELEQLRAMRDALLVDASRQSTLGDAYAALVVDTITATGRQ
jgi:hypothetical protein